MSVPHTGKLRALVNGIACEFNGETWATSDARLLAGLNAATASSPKQHFDILGLAEHVARKLELVFQLIDWTPDAPELDGLVESEGID